jgi:hypothetical protein
MSSLREAQAAVRHALIGSDTSAIAPLLVGWTATRFAVHLRHYQASLVRALLQRSPATVWLTGSAFVEGAARRFVSAHPPDRPCLAEYGDEFPAFVAALPEASALPYLRDFAELERRFGHAALQIDAPARSIGDIAALDVAALVETALVFQPGVRYWRAAWPVDELLTAYLTNLAPDRFELREETVYLEVRGARGDVRLQRLPAGDFAFRTYLALGCALGAAAQHALDVEPTFEPGRALAALFTEGLVTAVTPPHVEERR